MANKSKLKRIFDLLASPEERLAYELKRLKKRVGILEGNPPREVIHEKPIVTNEIKEVAVADTGEQIVDKVNRLKIEPEYQIDFSHIKNFPWHLVNRAGEAVGLASWGGSRVLAATGTIDDNNTSFTITSKPTVLIINGGIYQESGGAITWSYDSGALTLSVPVGIGGSIFGLQ